MTAIDVDHQLSKRWTRSVGDSSYGSVVVGPGTRLYTTSGSALVALDDHGDHGDVAWRADPGDDITEVSPGLAEDGTALLGTNGANEWAYHPDGTPKWHAPRIITYSSPSVTGTGLAYVGDHSGTVHVFRIDDGAQVAAYPAPGAQIWSSTILDKNYRLYLGTQSGHALGLDPKGAVVFDVDLGAPVDSYPALTADGALIIGARNATLTAIG